MRFDTARKMHTNVDLASRQDHTAGLNLWQALQGSGNPDDKCLEGIVDTMPGEFSALLRTDDTACAYAFGLLMPVYMGGGSGLKFRDSCRNVWEEFAERAHETKEFQEGFGWNTADAWKHTRSVQVATGDLEAVKRIARLAGRMYAAMRGGDAHKVRGIPQEVYSVELGNNVGRLLSSEHAFLADPNLEIITLSRLAAHKATQYAMRGTDKRSKGPLVLCLDESGSMHGRRNEWAKAAAVALARVAQDENRKCAVVHFSTSVYVQEMNNSPAAIGELIGHFLSGGTDIGRALRVATDQVAQLQSKTGQASDVILVTDGIDYNITAQTEAVANLKKIGGRLWSVAIECEIPEDNVLRKEASEYIPLGCAVGGNTYLSGNLDAKDAVPLCKAAR